MKKSTSRVWLGIRLTVSICFLKENVKCKKTIQNWKPTRCRAPSEAWYQADGVNLAVNRAAAHSQGHTSSPIPPSLPCKQDFQRAKEGGGRGWWMGGLMDRPDTGLSLLRINCFTPPPPPWKDFKAAKTRFKVAPHCQRMELKIGV